MRFWHQAGVSPCTAAAFGLCWGTWFIAPAWTPATILNLLAASRPNRPDGDLVAGVELSNGTMSAIASEEMRSLLFVTTSWAGSRRTSCPCPRSARPRQRALPHVFNPIRYTCRFAVNRKAARVRSFWARSLPHAGSDRPDANPSCRDRCRLYVAPWTASFVYLYSGSQRAKTADDPINRTSGRQTLVLYRERPGAIASRGWTSVNRRVAFDTAV
jgi:hypothetical protein